ncbi:fluoroquinolone transport system permease protein [Streptomyces sp. V3I8]|uniref:ABC transporter n=1 Tax=Streptomyces sp. V3I8 TaxID=3042279 RepID=UPI00278AED92|nr:ABC transporter [Streptomyces sp. V3I8]MDQ1037180.1 fluoroquinolone transport system permease protein [Streptomyces sp. V3I8]
MTRALLPAVWRTLPRRALMAAAAAGLLLACAPRMRSGPPAPWLGLFALRAAALAFALGLAFLLDDPARHLTAAVPVRRPVRIGLRVALVAPWAVLCWTAALLLVPARARPPVGALTLEAAATAVLALTAAALATRRRLTTEPGATISTWLLCTAAAAQLLLPHDWTLLVTPDDPRWSSTHTHWALLLAAVTAVGARACTEPIRAGLKPRPSS